MSENQVRRVRGVNIEPREQYKCCVEHVCVQFAPTSPPSRCVLMCVPNHCVFWSCDCENDPTANDCIRLCVTHCQMPRTISNQFVSQVAPYSTTAVAHNTENAENEEKESLCVCV